MLSTAYMFLLVQDKSLAIHAIQWLISSLLLKVHGKCVCAWESALYMGELGTLCSYRAYWYPLCLCKRCMRRRKELQREKNKKNRGMERNPFNFLLSHTEALIIQLHNLCAFWCIFIVKSIYPSVHLSSISFSLFIHPSIVSLSIHPVSVCTLSLFFIIQFPYIFRSCFSSLLCSFMSLTPVRKRKLENIVKIWASKLLSCFQPSPSLPLSPHRATAAFVLSHWAFHSLLNALGTFPIL